MKTKFSKTVGLIVFISCQLVAQKPTNYISQDLSWRNIGPANMMGRVAAIDALDDDYRTVLIASASGGVFKSTNAGMTWEAIFDHYGAGSIGSVAFFQPDPNIIWVGTGESANRNSSAYGDGIYKSIDGGNNWTRTNDGILESMNRSFGWYFGQIRIDPTDEDIVYALGVELSKTTNGGDSWETIAGYFNSDIIL